MTTVKKKVVKKVAVNKTNVKKSTSQSPKRRVVKAETEKIQDVFVDGMSNLSAGIEVVKITFYTDISSSETEVIRKHAFRLVMENSVMIDMVAKLKGSILKNADKYSVALDDHKKEILTLMDSLKE